MGRGQRARSQKRVCWVEACELTCCTWHLVRERRLFLINFKDQVIHRTELIRSIKNVPFKNNCHSNLLCSFTTYYPFENSEVKVAQSCLTLCDPMDYCPWNSPGQNIGRISLLEGFPPCRWILYQLSHQESPENSICYYTV